MPDQTEPLSPQAEAEDGGGPVKGFLEHLEDLRWVLIKSLATIGVAFVVCLLAGNWVVSVMTWPLKRAPSLEPHDAQAVSVLFGTNRLGLFHLTPEQQNSLDFGTNHYATLRLQPIVLGTNVVLGVQPESNPDREPKQLLVSLISLSPAGAFIVAVQVAIYAGFIISAPLILFFVAQFVFPALKWKEKKYIYRGLITGLGLFFSGVAFCYFALMPIALAASVKYTEWLGISVTQWRIEDYISFVCKFMLGMGIGFEMPVVILVLVKIGILNYSMLSKARRYVIIINCFMGAVLTTPEIITQILMAVPLQLLYEISVWIAWYWERQERKRAATEA